MLVLSRDAGESILIGDNVSVQVLEIKGKQVKIGITAPKSMPVHRNEIAERMGIDKPQ